MTIIGNLRRTLGLTQSEVAKRMGWKGEMAFIRVSAIETGRIYASDDAVKRMAKALNVPAIRLRKLADSTWSYSYYRRRKNEALTA